MAILDEIGASVGNWHKAPGPRSWASGSVGHRLGRRSRRGRGPDQRARRHGDHRDGHLLRRAHGGRRRGRARHRQRSGRHQRRHRGDPRTAVGRWGSRGDRDAGLRPGQPGRARAAGDVRVRLRRRADLPRSPRPAHHGATWHPPRCCPAPRAVRFSLPPDNCSGSIPTASAMASTWLFPPTRHFGAGRMRSPEVNQHNRPGSVWQSRRTHVARRLRRAVGLPESDGLLIRDVEEDSPAARAGLAQGDLIVAAAGRPIRTPASCSTPCRPPPGTVELNVIHGTGERTIQVTLGDGGQPD